MYCCKWGTTLEQSALVRYTAAVIGWTNKARQKFLFSSSNKTKLQSGAGRYKILHLQQYSNVGSNKTTLHMKQTLTTILLISAFFLRSAGQNDPKKI